jgi:hypothetical protein
MAAVIQAVLWVSTFSGLALIAGGARLVYLGVAGDVELRLFGSGLKASSVGAVGIFCGVVAVSVGLIFLLLRPLDRSGGQPPRKA